LGNNNLKQIAIVHKEFMNRLPVSSFDGQGTIKLSAYSPNKLVYESDSPSDQFAVFSEIWYGPDLGWTIAIDGKPAELVRANYALRACAIPSGKHQIVMEFRPRSFHLGKNLSMICSLLMIGLMGYAAYASWRKKDVVS
ncbi:MAG TPA: YfhO family protein, partial [Saprospiraceae bacterium]|nr:YfhO family protein [Saprospiraceae bacterium]